jgi:hypothetical protein
MRHGARRALVDVPRRPENGPARARSGGVVAGALTIALTIALALAGGSRSASAQAATVPPADSSSPGSHGPGTSLDSLPPTRIELADVLYLPGLFGLRMPAYDRSDGVSVRFGPRLALPDDRVVIDAVVTYRSNLGRFDPSLQGSVNLSHHLTAHALVERETLSNDDWNAADFTNSIGTLVGGSDGRNYFRADRGEASLEWHAERHDETAGATAFAGIRDEFSEAIGPDSGSTHSVWSVFDRGDRGGILRPNPSVPRGHIASGIAGLTGHWASAEGVSAAAKIGLEVPWTSPDGAPFAQITGDASLAFRGFFDHTFTLFAHALATDGATAPAQRFSYVGGTYTIPTMSLLQQGGGQLLWVESMYVIPLRVLTVPYLGAPAVAVRYVIGGAGVHSLPDLTQNVGLRLQLFILRVDGLIDPLTRHTVIALSGVVPQI